MQGRPYNCAVMFVDNSGIDIILGIFPFARELLNRGTNVSDVGRVRQNLDGLMKSCSSSLACRTLGGVSPEGGSGITCDHVTASRDGRGRAWPLR